MALSAAVLLREHGSTGAVTYFTNRLDPDPRKSVCDSVRGIWKGRMSTDEIMKLTRGE